MSSKDLVLGSDRVCFLVSGEDLGKQELRFHIFQGI